MAEKKTFKYSEPSSYFPESVRRKNKIGEFAEKKTDAKKTAKTTTKKSK